MAFNTAPGRAEYTATAGQTVFTYVFKAYSETDIKVYLTPAGQVADDVADLLTLTTDYTVVISGDVGGTITLVVPASNGDSITLVRTLEIDRQIEYQTSGDLLADTLNQDQNYQTYLIADKESDNTRFLKLQESAQGVSTEIPSPVPLNFFQWNAAGDAIINVSSLQADGFLWTAADVYNKTELNNGALDTRYYTETEVDTLLSNISSFKNKIINGNPLVNQRTYVSGTATIAANEYTLDRWRVVTLGQALTFATVENVVTMTLPTGGIEQVIEGLNLQSGTHTISFVATGDTVCTVDAVTKTSGDTFAVTGGTNVTVKFSSALGTGTVKFIQVEEGSSVTSFENRPFNLELALCKRYFEKSYDYATSVGAATSIGMLQYNSGTDNNNNKRLTETIEVEKRVTPTITTYDSAGVAGRIETWTASGTTNSVSGAASEVATSSFRIQNGAGGTAGFRAHYIIDAEI